MPFINLHLKVPVFNTILVSMKDNKYIGLGLALGVGIGTAVGVATGNLSMWLSLGIAIGLAIGAGLKKRNEEKES